MIKRLIVIVLFLAGFCYPSEIGISKADFEAVSPFGGELRIERPRNPQSTSSAALVSEPTLSVSHLQIKKVWITAYSSTPDETDDTPFITASGTQVRDGIVATNLLPFGTKIKIPALFGNKVFTVEDRMHARKRNVVDVWMSSKEHALQFGSSYTEIAVLN